MGTNTEGIPFKLDLSKIISLATIVGVMGGFYYLTNYRIEELEKKVGQLETTNVEIAKLEVEIKNVKLKTDEIYRLLIEDKLGNSNR